MAFQRLLMCASNFACFLINSEKNRSQNINYVSQYTVDMRFCVKSVKCESGIGDTEKSVLVSINNLEKYRLWTSFCNYPLPVYHSHFQTFASLFSIFFLLKAESHQHKIKLLCYIFSTPVFLKGGEYFSPSTQSIS
jgi:hypothetical protein